MIQLVMNHKRKSPPPPPPQCELGLHAVLRLFSGTYYALKRTNICLENTCFTELLLGTSQVLKSIPNKRYLLPY